MFPLFELYCIALMNFSARVITVAIETGDSNLMLSFSLSVFLNLAVIVSLIYCTEDSDNKNSNINDSAENIGEEMKNK